MLKGDLKKIYGVWHVIYSRENSGRIQEIELTDYSSRAISEKKGDNIKYLQDVYFDITNDGRAALNFFPDSPPTKTAKETKASKLREWYDTPLEFKNHIDEGCAMVQLEEQEKQTAKETKASKLRGWIAEGWAVVQLEEQEKQKAIKESLDKDPFSTGEKLTMKHLVSAYEEFLNLEQRQPSDTTDFVFHIHALQRILGQRVLRRDYPNTFTTYK